MKKYNLFPKLIDGWILVDNNDIVISDRMTEELADQHISNYITQQVFLKLSF